MKNGPYELVIAPDNYPGKRYRERYVYEHHLVWWRNTGKLVRPEYLIHHKNDQKRDNRFRNLEELTRAAHSSHHKRPRTMITLICLWCKKEFERAAQQCRWRVNRGDKNFYCCRSHQVSAQQKARWMMFRSSLMLEHRPVKASGLG